MLCGLRKQLTSSVMRCMGRQATAIQHAGTSQRLQMTAGACCEDGKGSCCSHVLHGRRHRHHLHWPSLKLRVMRVRDCKLCTMVDCSHSIKQA